MFSVCAGRRQSRVKREKPRGNRTKTRVKERERERVYVPLALRITPNVACAVMYAMGCNRNIEAKSGECFVLKSATE